LESHGGEAIGLSDAPESKMREQALASRRPTSRRPARASPIAISGVPAMEPSA